MNCPRFLLISLLLCFKSYDYILICFQLILFHCIQYIYKLRIVCFIPNFLELCRKKWLNVLLNFASFVVQCAQTIMLHCTNVCVLHKTLKFVWIDLFSRKLMCCHFLFYVSISLLSSFAYVFCISPENLFWVWYNI